MIPSDELIETRSQMFTRLVAEYQSSDSRYNERAEAWNLLADFAVENAEFLRDALNEYVKPDIARAASDDRPCTCHPDDNPPVPCPRKYALSECRAPSDGAVDMAALVERGTLQALRDANDRAESAEARNRVMLEALIEADLLLHSVEIQSMAKKARLRGFAGVCRLVRGALPAARPQVEGA